MISAALAVVVVLAADPAQVIAKAGEQHAEESITVTVVGTLRTGLVAIGAETILPSQRSVNSLLLQSRFERTCFRNRLAPAIPLQQFM